MRGGSGDEWGASCAPGQPRPAAAAHGWRAAGWPRLPFPEFTRAGGVLPVNGNAKALGVTRTSTSLTAPGASRPAPQKAAGDNPPKWVSAYLNVGGSGGAGEDPPG